MYCCFILVCFVVFLFVVGFLYAFACFVYLQVQFAVLPMKH